ncbi:MAG: protein-methionine-sulfoxide reductase heme-binding subunit MsrQ, partial [Lacisediminimonas sp.]|nr:protein-methionine-sulfoxide reductase heme-binding subunit MsrQ [Lacisediminimonas sp.]
TGTRFMLWLRRTLGLYTFLYASLHFLTFLWFDHFFDLAAMWEDVLERPFITVGFTAFVLLIPLAVTSNNAMIRRLGARQWQRLHRLVYLIAGLGILHFWWMKEGKNDFVEPILYGGIVLVLLLLRVWWAVSQRRAQAAGQLARR